MKFIAAVAIALLVMLLFRALAFTIYTVPTRGIPPQLISGDRVVVNRWSYGLRTGGRFFKYDRWIPSEVHKGDLIAFSNPNNLYHNEIYAGYVSALPGDTINDGTRLTIIPYKPLSPYNCYWVEGMGLLPETALIGRIALIAYSIDSLNRFRPHRTFLKIRNK